MQYNSVYSQYWVNTPYSFNYIGIFCVLVVVKVRYGSKFIYFLSILFYCYSALTLYLFFVVLVFCYFCVWHSRYFWNTIVLQFFCLFYTALCHFVVFLCVILRFMHFTILFSYITLFILLYQCVHYHQCNYLLVSKHFFLLSVVLIFLVVISYFSISVIIFVLLLGYLVSIISVFSITL